MFEQEFSLQKQRREGSKLEQWTSRKQISISSEMIDKTPQETNPK